MIKITYKDPCKISCVFIAKNSQKNRIFMQAKYLLNKDLTAINFTRSQATLIMKQEQIEQKEIYNYNFSSAKKALIVLTSPITAPFILFSKFMFKIKNIKIEIEYEDQPYV